MSLPPDVDQDRLAELALAILWLGSHRDRDCVRVWKGIDWHAMNLLFEKGWIDDPKSKSKSVRLMPAGAVLAREFDEQHLTKK